MVLSGLAQCSMSHVLPQLVLSMQSVTLPLKVTASGEHFLKKQDNIRSLPAILRPEMKEILLHPGIQVTQYFRFIRFLSFDDCLAAWRMTCEDGSFDAARARLYKLCVVQQ